jgi:uncharacterized membrane protein
MRGKPSLLVNNGEFAGGIYCLIYDFGIYLIVMIMFLKIG